VKKYILLFLSAFCALNSYAQSTQLRGRVLDAETNAAIPNINISISGSKGTTTDRDGVFLLPCNSDYLLITVSHVGFVTYKQKVACNQELTIRLTPSTRNLNEVEITDTSNPNKILLYQPVSIAKLNEVELKRGNGLLLDDAINANIPGVFMQRRTFSAGQQFNIRGYGNGARGTNGANSNFDGQGTKVYLNGIPITDAEGITLMDDIDFNSIGNVEVVKGAAGSIYGLAIAGVVNLRTMTPAPNKVSIGQDVLVGSYGLRRYTTSLQIGKERSSLLVNYGRQAFDGFMPHTLSRKDFVNVFGEFKPNDKQTINYYIGLSDSYDERNGELTKAQFESFDYSGNPNYIKNNAHSSVKTFRAGVGHTYKFNEAISNHTTIFGTGLASDVSSAGGWTDKSSVNYGLRSTFDTKFKIGNIAVSGITGVEMQLQNAQIIGYAMVVDSFNVKGDNIIGAARSNQSTVSKTLSAFTEWTLGLPSDFSITAGLGYSTMGIELNDRFFVAANNNPSNPRGTNNPSKYTANYNNMVSPHLALNKVISKQLSVYASFRQGYKAPVSSYFFIPVTGQVVRDLKPELGTQYEFGTKGTLFNDKLNFQIAVFYAEFTNKMTTVAVPNAANTATSYVYMVNGGSQKHTGLEIAVRGIAYESSTGFIKSINPFANFTYSNFKYGSDFKFQQLSTDRRGVTEVNFSNNVVVGVPPITFNAGFDFLTNLGFYGNVTYSYRDKMYYTSDNKNETNIYQLLNAKIGFQKSLGKRFNFDAYMAANNITGNQNYAMVFSNQLPDAYLPAPKEINYFGGINLKYSF